MSKNYEFICLSYRYWQFRVGSNEKLQLVTIKYFYIFYSLLTKILQNFANIRYNNYMFLFSSFEDKNLYWKCFISLVIWKYKTFVKKIEASQERNGCAIWGWSVGMK